MAFLPSLREHVRLRAEDRPGIYRMLGEDGAPIYVGKSVRVRSRRGEVREMMRRRVGKVLAIAAHHGHEALVLGAWGCGVFGNDTQEVAELFREALAARFRGAFSRVVFAVLDWSEGRRFLGPFERAFGAAG